MMADRAVVDAPAQYAAKPKVRLSERGPPPASAVA